VRPFNGRRSYGERGAAEIPESVLFDVSLWVDSPGELRPRADAELAVDPLEVGLHGVDAEEQSRADLGVG
jgi:hypothetical protein